MCLPCFTEVFVEEETKKKEEILYTVWDSKTRTYVKVPKAMVGQFEVSLSYHLLSVSELPLSERGSSPSNLMVPHSSHDAKTTNT